ncbi:hypothetical protein N7490_008256 [Penicillium lividum]|nr:hypothetical protein N7490_008256 [Penicillium lividum]
MTNSLTPDERYEQSLTYGLIIGTGVLSMIVCSLRLYSRAVILKRFGLDDIAVCISLVITQCFNGLGIAVVYYGEGRHFDNVSLAYKAIWLKLYYSAMCLYLFASLSVKISLLLFLRRIFVKVWMHWLTIGLMVFQFIFSISGSVVLATQCDPPRAAYDMTVTNAKCYSEFKLYQIVLYQAVLIFVADVIMLVAPMIILWQLNMPTRKIIALMAIFGTGIIACIAPVVRFSTLDYLRNETSDLTYESASSLYWMAIEFNLGLVAGSLSSLKPLPIFRRFGSSAGSKYKGSTGVTGQELGALSERDTKNRKKVSQSWDGDDNPGRKHQREPRAHFPGRLINNSSPNRVNCVVHDPAFRPTTMYNMKTPTYNSKEPLILDLKNFICRSSERVDHFNAAIKSAIHGGRKDLNFEGIKDLDSYLQWCEGLLRWVPNVDTAGDELLRKILVFYWDFDQPSVLYLQTPMTPDKSNIGLSWLSHWLVCFARQQGEFMNTPESAGRIDTFYMNPKYSQEASLWEQPETGWMSFNHWFGRSWKNISRACPIDSPHDDKVVIMSADSVYDGNWRIEKGKVDLQFKFKETIWDEGHFTHSFLGPADYHRQHSPVSGTVIEARVIHSQVYLHVAESSRLCTDQATIRAPAEIKRRLGMRIQYESEGEGNGTEIFADLDAPDRPGYQWCQTRGLIVIQTEKYGRVAILPIGMAQVSSVIISVKQVDIVKKGDQIFYFQLGGSDCVMVFEKRVDFKFPRKTKINVRKQIAPFLK